MDRSKIKQLITDHLAALEEFGAGKGSEYFTA